VALQTLLEHSTMSAVFEMMKLIFCCFDVCHSTRYYETAVFLHLYLQFFHRSPSRHANRLLPISKTNDR